MTAPHSALAETHGRSLIHFVTVFRDSVLACFLNTHSICYCRGRRRQPAVVKPQRAGCAGVVLIHNQRRCAGSRDNARATRDAKSPRLHSASVVGARIALTVPITFSPTPASERTSAFPSEFVSPITSAGSVSLLHAILPVSSAHQELKFELLSKIKPPAFLSDHCVGNTGCH